MASGRQGQSFNFSATQRRELEKILQKRSRGRGPAAWNPSGHFWEGEPVTLEVVVARLEWLTGRILAGEIDPDSWRQYATELQARGGETYADLTMLLKRRVGRPIKANRLEIAKTIAKILAQSGVRISRAREGVLACTIVLVLDAAGIDVPGEDALKDLMRDIYLKPWLDGTVQWL
jgi:hypothetical protein